MIVETAHGPARVHLDAAAEPVGGLVLGHGAGGPVTAADLVAVTAAAVATGWSVARVEQPYRVAGRRAPAPAGQLDTAWTTVVAGLVDGPFAGLPLVCGGRSSGARVACRTAAAVGAAGVLCLAFPLHPPARAGKERKDRTPELELVEVPVLVVQGERDAFGMPATAPGRAVVRVPGTHALTQDVAGVAAAVSAWLASLM